ncbi:Ig-like domain-containing protein [Paenibacillus nasutitermitis]|uniref:BIG2 domain-containing protein n=1 Tax=Paenibacillus nasutitermitis TaxID=1652958 RepID=A0A916ZF28_9BACL|nr:Ig-like domain-containing protein [Paenibacillus nasutitermitis]GGD92483.1 hypothetical protein GCM10010911_58870 [Paenibacillus nasutitermitis]
MIMVKNMKPHRPARVWFAALLALSLCMSSISGIAFAAEDTVTGIQFNSIPSSTKLIVEEDAIILALNATIQGLTSTKDVTSDATWSSSNAAAVKVDKGILTGLSSGSATISAQYKGFKVTLDVTSEYRYESMKLTQNGLDPGDSDDVLLGETPEYKLSAAKSGNSDTDVTSSATWTSSNTAVATVSAGKVTLVAAGEATITGKFKGKSDAIKLKVTSPFKSISISPKTLLELKTGDPETTLSATAEPKSGSSKNVTADAAWASGNASIVTVDKGVVKAIGPGTTAITVSYLGVSSSIDVVVRPAYEAMRITPKEDQHLLLNGQPVAFSLIVLNDEETTIDVSEEATWKSSNPFAATVTVDTANHTVMVSPKGIGRTTITATYKGLSQQASVIVYPTITSLTVAKDTADVFLNEAVVIPAVTAKALAGDSVDVSSLVSWTSSDETVLAKEDGKWVGKKVGTAVLKAEVQSKTVSVTVSVNEKPLVLITELQNISIVVGKELKLPSVKVIYESGMEEDISAKIAWKTSSPNLLLKSPNMKGLVVSNVSLTGTYLGKTLTLPVTIEEEITKLFVDATYVVLNPGRSKTFKVTGIYKSGKSVNLASKINWTLNPETLATVKGSNVKALVEGSGKLVGTYQDKTVEVVIAVKPKLKKLVLSDKSFTLAPGASETVKLTAEYEGDKVVDITKSAVWTTSSSKTAIVTGGTIKAIAKGSATIKAVYEGKTITLRVTVKP